ncbi:hypothetical protein [Parabacteroides sp.]
MKDKKETDKLQATSKEKEEKSKLQVPTGAQTLDEEELGQASGGIGFSSYIKYPKG